MPIEWEIDENVSVQGQADSDDPNNPTGIDVGLDVKWREEGQ